MVSWNVIRARSCQSAKQSIFIRVEKYRPDTLDDVVSHKDITGTSEWCCTLPNLPGSNAYTLSCLQLRTL
jgi:hypothetical protein